MYKFRFGEAARGVTFVPSYLDFGTFVRFYTTIGDLRKAGRLLLVGSVVFGPPEFSSLRGGNSKSLAIR